MKTKIKTEAELLAERQKCYYRIDIDMSVFEDSGRHFEQSTTFKGSDLLDCRERAIDYYHTIYDHIMDAGTFCGMPFARYEASISGKTAIHSVVMFFINNHGDELTLLGWDKGESLDSIGDEFSTLLGLGYQRGQIPVLWDSDVSYDEAQTIYNEVEQAVTT